MGKKIISLFVVCVLCLLIAMPSVFAAVEVSVVADGELENAGEIIVTGNVGAERIEYLLAIITEDGTDADSLDFSQLGDFAYTMGYAMSDAKGNYEVSLRLNDNYDTDDYTVVVVTGTNNRAEAPLSYESPYALRDLYKLASESEFDASAFISLFEDNAVAFDTSKVYYDNDGFDKNAWAQTMNAILPASAEYGQAPTEFNKLFSQAEYLTKLNSLADASAINNFLKETQTRNALGVDQRYTNVSLAEDIRLAVSGKVLDQRPTTPQLLKELIVKSLAVEEFARGTDKQDFINLTGKYSDIVNVTGDADSTTKLNSVGNANACEYMYQNFTNGVGDFTTAEGIVAAYKKGIADAYTAIYGNGGSGDGGSGDGGSGDGGSGDVGGGAPSGGVITPGVDENKEKLTFTDLGRYGWAKDAIYSLVDDGVLSGVGDGTFRPGEMVTREQFVTMLVNRYQKSTKADITRFVDVKPGAWYYDYVAIGVGSGMVYGLSDTEFGVGKPITRQDLAVMAYRAMGSQYVATGDIALRDIDSVADYARTAVEALYEMKIISGDENGNFRPADNATRAEAARILYLLK